jgi:hypothetical protein
VTPTLQRVIGVAGLAAAIFNITVGAAIFVLTWCAAAIAVPLWSGYSQVALGAHCGYIMSYSTMPL